jgi:hypothetical protein
MTNAILQCVVAQHESWPGRHQTACCAGLLAAMAFAGADIRSQPLDARVGSSGQGVPTTGTGHAPLGHLGEFRSRRMTFRPESLRLAVYSFCALPDTRDHRKLSAHPAFGVPHRAHFANWFFRASVDVTEVTS